MKKNKKGFTLTEVLIAMAIFAIMSLLVCSLYAFLNRMIVTSDKTSDKVDGQMGKYENEVVDPLADSSSIGQIYFSYGGDTATVDVDVKTIDGSVPDGNPNIQYFNKN